MTEKLEFRAKLFRPDVAGSTTFLRAPAKVMKAFDTKARVPVAGTLDGVPFRSSLSPMGGSHLLPVNAKLRAAAKVEAGDTVTVVLERVERLAGRMSVGGNSANLGKQLGRAIKRSYLVGGYVRTHCLFDGLKEAF